MVHDAFLAHVPGTGLVHQAAVVPDHHFAWRPAVLVDAWRLAGEGHEFVQERLRVLLAQPVNGVRVAADGTVQNPGGTQLVDLSFAIGRPDLEYAGGTYLLAWGSGSVSGLRFTSNGVLLGGPFAIGTGSSSQPRIATDGQDFLVAWQNQDLGNSVRARSRR